MDSGVDTVGMKVMDADTKLEEEDKDETSSSCEDVEIVGGGSVVMDNGVLVTLGEDIVDMTDVRTNTVVEDEDGDETSFSSEVLEIVGRVNSSQVVEAEISDGSFGVPCSVGITMLGDKEKVRISLKCEVVEIVEGDNFSSVIPADISVGSFGVLCSIVIYNGVPVTLGVDTADMIVVEINTVREAEVRIEISSNSAVVGSIGGVNSSSAVAVKIWVIPVGVPCSVFKDNGVLVTLGVNTVDLIDVGINIILEDEN